MRLFLRRGFTLRRFLRLLRLAGGSGYGEPLAAANLLTLKALIAKADASTQLKPGNYTVEEPPKEGEETA